MITVNGKDIPLTKSLTLQEYLEQNHYQLKRVAVEMNDQIVPKADYASVILHSGDKLEVVSFVGGG